MSAGQEAPDLENSLDILGRFGWEVVTIVGSIGGDQQIVLKRKYNRITANSEYAAIIKGKDLYIKDLVDIMEREQRLRDEAAKAAESERAKPKLIDLDEVEARARQVQKEAEIRETYQIAFAKSEFSAFSTIDIDARFGGARIVINSDLTDRLLKDGVNYRSSEVNSLIRPMLASFRFIAPNIDRFSTVTITVKSNIKFSGNTILVHTHKTSKFQGSSTDWSLD